MDMQAAIRRVTCDQSVPASPFEFVVPADSVSMSNMTSAICICFVTETISLYCTGKSCTTERDGSQHTKNETGLGISFTGISFFFRLVRFRIGGTKCSAADDRD